jgi:hypothetical protein
MSTLINSTTISQNDSILAYMLNGNRITPIEALNLFQCFRLTSRICDLKQRGFDIKKEFVKVNSGKKVMSYWIDIENN